MTGQAIARLLEKAGDSASLLARLKTREADRAQVQSALAQADAETPATDLPTAAALMAGYAGQVARLETLLTGSDALNEANRLLHELLGTGCGCAGRGGARRAAD